MDFVDVGDAAVDLGEIRFAARFDTYPIRLE